jgi:hypothetical protein
MNAAPLASAILGAWALYMALGLVSGLAKLCVLALPCLLSARALWRIHK